MRADSGLAAHGRRGALAFLVESGGSVLDVRQPVDRVRAVHMPVDAACDPGHAKPQGSRPNFEGMRASRLPGAASRWRCPAIDIVRVVDRGGNCGCWLHTRRASFHQLLCVAHARKVFGQRGNAMSHRPGEQSPDLRSDQLSRVSPREGEHSPRGEPCAVKEVEAQEQTR